MSEFYLVAVVILFALAITDLVVGVSNDAVNFLNSAIGSKVATRRTILIVASLGIFIGATFSSGMMEIARKGIFNPEFFYFSDVMVIFLAVMLADIILLDLFNTFGMPTSTTVSIVFELLGAAVIMALIKVTAGGESLDALNQYINSGRALAIISGIFISVVVAFSVGALVQYFSRLLFSFEYNKRLKYVGALWTGFAFTALSYFLVFKGLKGASFVQAETLAWINDNIMLLLVVSFVFWTIVMQVLLLLKVKILRVVVLFGTFSLAMAFAGNDLVNFIGVPIAGFESYLSWSGSPDVVPANEYLMNSLKEPVRTDTYLLLIAGLVMVLTLWFSKKARSVTETEVNLGRQNEGAERFRPNAFSRGIVRVSRGVGAGVMGVMPAGWKAAMERNFVEPHVPIQDKDRPAFDMVRASVNLTVASMLIALATSLKLPLSTTYVSFMVAMGTSLSDRAWGRESAVYRVAGVLNVIGGWLLTALIAFTMAGIFAAIIYSFELFGLLAVLALALFSIGRSFLFHRAKTKAKDQVEMKEHLHFLEQNDLREGSRKILLQTAQQIRDSYAAILNGLFQEDIRLLNEARTRLGNVCKENELLRDHLYRIFKVRDANDPEQSRALIRTAAQLQDVIQSTEFLLKTARMHVLNSHKPLLQEQTDMLRSLGQQIEGYLDLVTQVLREEAEVQEARTRKVETLDAVEQGMNLQLQWMQANGLSQKNNNLVFSFLLETRDLVEVHQSMIEEHVPARAISRP